VPVPEARIPEPTRPADSDGANRDTSPAPEASGEGAGGDGGRSLVRVTVNLTPRAVDALEAACHRTKDSKTDSINRALMVYNLVLELIEQGGGTLTLQTREGHTERIHLL
jgi:hypothetical protein